MGKPFYIEICKQAFWLLPEKAVYWPAQKMLIISDIHLGKSGHFRKSGIAVPQAVFLNDLQKLVTLIHHTQCKTLLITGDFFHSEENKELVLFKKWLSDLKNLEIKLIMGNHDILPGSIYSRSGIECIEDCFVIEEILFIHDPENIPEAFDGYAFCGHIHPGVRIKSKAKQSIILPCFHLTKKYCILPAFSSFAGAMPARKTKGDRFIAVAKNSLIEVVSASFNR
ncbi:MAG: ligase-associated DNA damage response endonuclease PdeM [Bacteroidetes bacterium]|nr:ligase-associated DNA damage response endonuclease PdeM [Bacteroidota bacterium]